MRILISNDDGVYAPGIITLAAELKKLATEIHVFAPDRDRSAASKSLTIHTPIRARTLENGFVSVDGTPTDCVHLALTCKLKTRLPDLIVTGINQGSNLGDDVLYSGTVSAATEGSLFGLPAIAVSLATNQDKSFHYETAAKFIYNLILNLKHNNTMLVPGVVWNINIPDVPSSEIRGVKVCRLGQRHRAQMMIEDKSPRGESIYWVGPPGPEQDAGQDTDFYAIRNNFISITPLKMDLTHIEQISQTRRIIQSIKSTDYAN